MTQNKKHAGGGASWRLKEALHERERARRRPPSQPPAWKTLSPLRTL